MMSQLHSTGKDRDEIVTGGADCMPINSKTYSMRSEVPPKSEEKEIINQEKIDAHFMNYNNMALFDANQ